MQRNTNSLLFSSGGAYLSEVDGQAVRNHEDAEEGEVALLDQELERVHHPHLGLLLLLLLHHLFKGVTISFSIGQVAWLTWT